MAKLIWIEECNVTDGYICFTLLKHMYVYACWSLRHMQIEWKTRTIFAF